MKVIRLEIQDLPDSFAQPYLERVKLPKLSPKIFESLDTLTYDESYSVTKELYPNKAFALGEHMERFYIRDKDLEAFGQMIKVFVDKSQSNLIDQVIEWCKTNGKMPAKESWNGATADECMSYNQALSDVIDYLQGLKEKNA